LNWYEYQITSDYGNRIHPITKEYKLHSGIDYAVPENTPIKSNVSGTVTTSTYNEGYGNYVVIKDNSDKMHYFAHLNNSSVNVGDTVNVNDVIGLSGNTGMSTGAHLHYEIRNKDNQSVNPSIYLNSNIGNYNYLDMNSYNEEQMQLNNEKNSLIGKVKKFIGETFKYLVIVLLLCLFFVFITKSLDIEK